MSTLASPSTKRRLSDSAGNGVTQPIPKKSLQIRTDKPRPHLCTVCTRGFARLEHLKRHERAHTNEKPYQCAACGRCFARRDLVLRHQQKLHSSIFSVARRGSLPASLGPGLETEAPVATNAPNENVIVLRNNTRAKAPLPGSSDAPGGGPGYADSDSVDSSPQNESPFATSGPSNTRSSNSGPSNPGPSHAGSATRRSMDNPKAMDQIHPDLMGAGAEHAQHFKSHGVIPSPNTNSYNNTPSNSGSNPGASSSFSDLEMLQNHNFSASEYTQQPSPLTGDSPGHKEKERSLKEKARQDFLNDQLEFKSSLELKKFAGFGRLQSIAQSSSNPRHSSFSAVSGLSYTNLQDALTIRNNQMPQGPEHVGFATPQLTATDVDYGDLNAPGLSNTDFNWYSLNFNESGRAENRPENVAPTDPLLGKPKTATGFKMSLNTIPSESQLDKTFLGETAQNNIIASHQFHNPEHPHHIPGTTPMEFAYPLSEDPLHGADYQKIQYGSGFTQLSQDLLYLQEHEAAKHSPHSSPAVKSDHTTTPQDPNRKLGFVNEIDDLGWLEEIKGIPLPNDLPLASTDTGFVGMPFVNDEFQSDEVFSLFKFKQDDFVRQKSIVDMSAAKELTRNETAMQGQASKGAPRAMFTIGDPNEFITDDLRSRIIRASNVSEDHFPPKEDLNAYMNLYGEEFNKYFSFIHLPTLKNPMVDNFENIPMILAMCAIGALYSYHDSNTLLLFNLSKFHIHKFFETEVTPNKLQSKKVPIMAHQCLVLHIFISMFLNEPDMVEITSRQMGSMVGLIRSTNFHRPLEQFLMPPPEISNPNDKGNLQNNFGYFIMAQTRIRTVQAFYQLEVMRSILLGSPLPMGGLEMRNGTQCNDEGLWKAGNAEEWFASYSKSNERNIVQVSNNQSLSTLAQQLNGPQIISNSDSLDKAMALLMHVHEQISSSYAGIRGKFDPYSWRVDCRPKLELMISSWEEFFVRNGGSGVIHNRNQAILSGSSELKLILPLSLLAKIRLAVNVSPITATVLHRDWNGMNHYLKELENDIDGLKEAAKFALETLDLWIQNISMANGAQQFSVRTPVFFLAAVFISVVVLGKTLETIESGMSLSASDRALWLSCEKTLRNIESTLSSHEETSYSDFLNRQSGGVFDFAQSKLYQENVNTVLKEKSTRMKSVSNCKLSTHALGMGVRILADAPLWPIAMRFAEALKHMAMSINGKH